MQIVKNHPSLPIQCRNDGAVLIPPDGRRFKTFRWTFGSSDMSYGYRRVKYRGKFYRVHRLICEAFHGPAPEDKPFVDSVRSALRCEHRDRSRGGCAAPRPEQPSARQCDCPRTWLRGCTSDRPRSRCLCCSCCSPSHDNLAQRQVGNRTRYHHDAHIDDSLGKLRSLWHDGYASASRW